MATATKFDLDQYCANVALQAKQASARLAVTDTEVKNHWLTRSAELLRDNVQRIEHANAQDLAAAPGYGLSDAAIDRLRLTPKRIEEIAVGLEQVAALADPIGEVIRSTARPNGLRIDKVRVPLGVVFFIYESRPNVTADAAAICVKSGNAVILRGGKEAMHSSQAIVDLLAEAADEVGLPADAVQLVSTTDRAAVGKFLAMPRVYRPGDSARRRGADSPRGRRGQDARHQALHGQLPRVCRCGRRPRYGPRDRDQQQVPADGCLQRGRVARGACRCGGRVFAGDWAGTCRNTASRFAATSARASWFRTRSQQARGLRRRIPGPDHFVARRGLARRSDRAHQPLRLETHGRDRDGRRQRQHASSPNGSTARP